MGKAERGEEKEEEKEVWSQCPLKSDGFIENWTLLGQEAKWAAAAVPYWHVAYRWEDPKGAAPLPNAVPLRKALTMVLAI